MEQKYSLEEVCYAIKKSWCKETCYPKERDLWSKKNPTLGQDAVTSILLYDYFKGNIKKCFVNGNAHYFNIIQKEIVDLTQEHFLGQEILYEQAVYKKRSDLLKNENVKKRYLLLKERVESILE